MTQVKKGVSSALLSLSINIVFTGDLLKMRPTTLALAANLLLATVASSSLFGTEFILLQTPGQIGKKPSAPAPTAGDWLIGTADDQALASGYNPSGAWSHNLADMAGTTGATFANAPSLTGKLYLDLTPTQSGDWNVSVTGQQYSGQATPMMQMNQFLVTPGSAPTLNPAFGVDGLGNSGQWLPNQNWEISYNLDFYFATNADGNPSPDDVDLAFSNKTQQGYLIPVSQLTTAGLSSLALNDPAGFYGSDFKAYLLAVAEELPAGATYLLFTQMAKTNPNFAEAGLPITTSGLVGNTTIAYSMTPVPEPSLLAHSSALLALLFWRRRKRAAHRRAAAAQASGV